jgi:glycosyltransferase involved in cell wall biosynthesis
MEKLKILWFNWRCWLNPEMGGAEVFTHEVSKHWVEAGHEVTLFTSKFHDCKIEEIIDDVRIVRAGGKYTNYGEAKKYYKKRFSREGYDVVIDEINTRPYFTPKFVNKGEKVVALIHQLAREFWFYETFFPINYLGYHYFEKKWLRNYVNTPIVTVSESTKQDLLNWSLRKVFVISEGLNFNPLFKVPEKETYPVIVYSGRLKKAKRPDHAVKAFKIIKDCIPEAELWIVGDGPFKRTLEKMSGEGIKFFGKLLNDNRRELFKKSWVLVNPSIREGWGLNVIEANALGVPVVAYDVPGLRDSVQDEITGLLVESGNISALAKQIIRILQNDLLRCKLNENALNGTKEFSWTKTSEQFMSVIEREING